MTSGTEIILGKLGLFSVRHEHSISVPDSTSLNHCSTDKTLQHLFILVSSLIKGVTSLVSILLEPKIHYQKENPFIGRAKRAPHWGVQSRFRVIYIYLYHVTSSVIYVIGRKVWVMFA